MQYFKTIVLSLSLLLAALAHPVQATLYQIYDLGTLGGLTSSALAVNGSGTVVGSSDLSNFTSQAFGYSDGSMQGIGMTAAVDINDNGQIAGRRKSDTGLTQAVVWDGGTITVVGPAGYSSTATAINQNGSGVGNYSAESGSLGFFFDESGWRDLAPLAGAYSAAWDINDSDQIAGLSSTTDGYIHAVRWDDFTAVDLGTLGGSNSYGQGINESGQVVGYSDTASGQTHAFVHDGEAMIDLGTLGGEDSYAYAIDDAGRIVGRAETIDGYLRAFLYENGTMYDLLDLVENPEGWDYLAAAYDIGEDGTIVGYGLIDGQRHAFMLVEITAVPVPGAALLLTSALSAVVGWRRRYGN